MNPWRLEVEHHDLARRWGRGQEQLAIGSESKVVGCHTGWDPRLNLATCAVQEDDLVRAFCRDDYEIASLSCLNPRASGQQD